MSDLTSVVASGLNSLMNEYNSVAHNLANSSTSGYKQRVTTFSSQMQTIMNEDFSPLAGSIDSSEWINFIQGQLKRTDRPLDVAIEGNGFLTLETPEGRLYTRNGSLQVNILGQLTDLNGHLVSGQNGPITIPRSVSDSDIQIDSSGLVRAGQSDLGKMKLAAFETPASDLEPTGNGCYRPRQDVEPQPVKDASVRQGYQENSNINPVGELTNLLGISRIFEANINYLKKQSQNSNALIQAANS